MKFIHSDKVKDFSLVLGGPLYQFYLRTFLATPPLNLCRRRVIFIALFAWLPLLALTILGGRVMSGVRLPFIFDLDTHLRFLASLALLIAAEVNVHHVMGLIIRQFLERDIIAKDDQKQFNYYISSNMKLRDSKAIEVLLIILVYTVGYWFWKEYVNLETTTWYLTQVDGISKFTLAGIWYVFISLPIYQFILCRWYFRLFIWYRFLWQVSRMPLHLNALHPDKAGGIGFLAYSLFVLSPLLIAHTILLSGLIANRIWYGGVALIDFKLEIIAAIIFLVFLVLAPLLFFMPVLARAKRNGLLSYGGIASHYVNSFYRKWLVNNAAQHDDILGNSDIQSLADLSNSFQVVREMRVLPVRAKTILQLIILIALPLIPLMISMAPLENIIVRLIRIIL